MIHYLRDAALSFAPAWARKEYRPQSSETVLWAATITGLLQTIACPIGLLFGFSAFLAARARQLGNLQGANETTQIWFSGIFLVEYILFHPLALLLCYMALEGMVRFIGGLCVSEVVPSLPVVLVFAVKARLRNRRGQRTLDAKAAIPDAVETLEDGFRVASALPKAGWNANMTLEVHEQWYEVVREETGAPPRTHVYVLRRAPIGKILRGFERYDPNLKREAAGKP